MKINSLNKIKNTKIINKNAKLTTIIFKITRLCFLKLGAPIKADRVQWMKQRCIYQTERAKHVPSHPIYLCLTAVSYPECFRNRAGVHRVHGGCDRDARLTGVGRALLRHALQSGSVLYVW